MLASALEGFNVLFTIEIGCCTPLKRHEHEIFILGEGLLRASIKEIEIS